MGRLPRSSLIAGAFAMVLLMQPASTLANHQGNCVAPVTGHQAGRLSQPWIDHRYGVKAVFEGQSLSPCLSPATGEIDATTVWVAIQGPAYPNDIVQFGMGKCRGLSGCNVAMQDGYAWGRDQRAAGCSGMSDVVPTGHWLGGWSSGGGQFSLTQDAAGNFQMVSPSFIVNLSTGSICWTNETVAIFGETKDDGDALGGEVTNKYRYTTTRFKTSAAGAWLTLEMYCTNVDPNPIYKCSATGADLMDLWTER